MIGIVAIFMVIGAIFVVIGIYNQNHSLYYASYEERKEFLDNCTEYQDYIKERDKLDKLYDGFDVYVPYESTFNGKFWHPFAKDFNACKNRIISKLDKKYGKSKYTVDYYYFQTYKMDYVYGEMVECNCKRMYFKVTSIDKEKAIKKES